MAQVSINPLSLKTSERIFEILISVVAALDKAEDIQEFLNDLLSPTEKVMLAKRLTIAYLLLKGYDQRSICAIMKVSLGTVSRVSNSLQTKGKGYKGVIGKVFAKDKMSQIIEKLDNFLFELLPPPGGVNWAERKRVHYEEKKRRRKPF